MITINGVEVIADIIHRDEKHATVLVSSGFDGSSSEVITLEHYNPFTENLVSLSSNSYSVSCSETMLSFQDNQYLISMDLI